MKKIFFLLPLLFLFAGCGEIELVDSIPPTPTPTFTTTPSTASVAPSPQTSLECTDVQKERDNLSEAITKMQEELQACLTEKNLLASSTETAAKNDASETRFMPIIQKYLKDVPQKEFPFTPGLCGGLGTVTGKSWYAEFAKKLEETGISFSPLSRPLKAEDLSGVCASEEGKISIFIGAQSENKREFHMLKYHIDTQKIETAILLSGSCDVCPTKFGKRVGPYITLIGEAGGKQKNYDYYYDANVIVTK